jgi:isoleucyl-tRNA synthetase
MDRYLLAHTRSLADGARADLDAYDIVGACERVGDFLDILTNWYVRTQRQRFWDEDALAFDTLRTALVTLTEVAAPLLPLLAEEIWRGLTGGESVHLTDWPSLPDTVADDALVRAMDEVRDVVSAAHSLRKTHALRVRQPLTALAVVSEQAGALAPFTGLIASEVNVKEVRLQTPAESGLAVHQELSLNPRAFGPAVRRSTSALFAAQKAGAWSLAPDGRSVVFPGVAVDGAPVVLAGDQFRVSTKVDASDGQVAAVLAGGTFVVLDTELTPGLLAEGYARDVIRAVQDRRKAEDLHIADRIDLALGVPAGHVEDVRNFADMISAETLALSLTVSEAPELTVSVSRHPS